MYYEGAVAISSFCGVDVFQLSDKILHNRWLKLIAAFVWATRKNEFPASWFGLAPVPSADGPFSTYLNKVLKELGDCDETVVRTLILGVLKVCMGASTACGCCVRNGCACELDLCTCKLSTYLADLFL